MSSRIVVKAINPQKLSHKFQFSVVVENMYEHEVVGPINQVKNYEDAGEEVKGHLKKENVKIFINVANYLTTVREALKKIGFC